MAVNDAVAEDTEEDVAFGTAINIAPIDETQDDWINISPYGEFPNEKGTQIVDRDAADSMVTAFNSFLGKVGRLFRGIPIYRGHPHQRPDIWPDDARYGRINELQARGDGLYGKVAWNDLGKKNIEQGYYVYPSPGWHYQKLPGGKIKPVAVNHIGLTNNPQIFEAVPLTKNTNGNGGASQFSANNPPQPAGATNKNTPNMKKMLTKLLGLNEDAKDEEVVSAYEKKLPAIAQNTELLASKTQELVAVNTQLDQAKGETQKFRDLAINAQLDRFTDKGVITAAERDGYKTKFEANFDGTLTELKDKQPALNTQSLKLQPNGKDLSDASKRRIAFNSRLDELMQPDRDGKSLTIDQAIQKMRSNQEDKALLDAMQQPIAA